MLDDMLALVNSVCLHVLSRSCRHVFALLICAGVTAFCCDVWCSTTTCSYVHILKRPTRTKVWGKKAFPRKRTDKNWENACLQVMKEDVIQVGALRGERGANGACWGRKTKQESLYLHLIRFLTRSDKLLNPNYGRSAIGPERTILIPITVILYRPS